MDYASIFETAITRSSDYRVTRTIATTSVALTAANNSPIEVEMKRFLALLAGAFFMGLSAHAEELVPPTAEEARDIARWIPETCCRTNNCCRKVHEGAVIQLPDRQVRIVTTGQVIARTGWSQDGQTWRCTCDFDNATQTWIVHERANTRCVFPIPRGS